MSTVERNHINMGDCRVFENCASNQDEPAVAVEWALAGQYLMLFR